MNLKNDKSILRSIYSPNVEALPEYIESKDKGSTPLNKWNYLKEKQTIQFKLRAQVIYVPLAMKRNQHLKTAQTAWCPLPLVGQQICEQNTKK